MGPHYSSRVPTDLRHRHVCLGEIVAIALRPGNEVNTTRPTAIYHFQEETHIACVVSAKIDGVSSMSIAYPRKYVRRWDTS